MTAVKELRAKAILIGATIAGLAFLGYCYWDEDNSAVAAREEYRRVHPNGYLWIQAGPMHIMVENVLQNGRAQIYRWLHI